MKQATRGNVGVGAAAAQRRAAATLPRTPLQVRRSSPIDEQRTSHHEADDASTGPSSSISAAPPIPPRPWATLAAVDAHTAASGGGGGGVGGGAGRPPAPLRVLHWPDLVEAITPEARAPAPGSPAAAADAAAGAVAAAAAAARAPAPRPGRGGGGGGRMSGGGGGGGSGSTWMVPTTSRWLKSGHSLQASRPQRQQQQQPQPPADSGGAESSADAKVSSSGSGNGSGSGSSSGGTTSSVAELLEQLRRPSGPAATRPLADREGRPVKQQRIQRPWGYAWARAPPIVRAAWLAENAAANGSGGGGGGGEAAGLRPTQSLDSDSAAPPSPSSARETRAAIARLLLQHLRRDAGDWRGVAALAGDWYPWLAASPRLLCAALSRTAALYPRGVRLPGGGGTGGVAVGGVGGGIGGGGAGQGGGEAATADGADSVEAPLVSRDEAALVSQLLVLARRQLPNMRPRHVDTVLRSVRRLRVADEATVAALGQRYREVLPDAALATAGSSLLALVGLGCSAARPGPLGGAFLSEYSSALSRGLKEQEEGQEDEVERKEEERKEGGGDDVEEEEEEEGHGLALALYALGRWAGRGVVPRRNLLRQWARVTSPLLRSWAPRDLALGAQALGTLRASGRGADAWAMAAMAASLQPRQLSRMAAEDAVGLLVGFAAMREAAREAAHAAAHAAAARQAVGGGSGSGSSMDSSDDDGTGLYDGEAPNAGATTPPYDQQQARWWSAHQAAMLVLLPGLSLSQVTLSLSAAGRLRWRVTGEWAARFGLRGAELARAAAAGAGANAGGGHSSACLLLSSLARVVSAGLAPEDADEVRRALAPGVTAVAVALAPRLERGGCGALDLVQLVGALARLGVRPGPSFTAAHARGVERVSADVTPAMWRELRGAYAALRLQPSTGMLRAFELNG